LRFVRTTIISGVSAAGEKVAAARSRGWIDHAEATIQRTGHRSSVPRSAVVDLVGRQRCVLSAQEIADQLRAEGRDVGIATVYRTLDLLTDLALVQRLDAGGGTTRYEPAMPDGDHHHHLVCDRCGRVTAFEDEPLERAIERLADRLEYRVGGHEVILRGACPRCAAAS
jgi:Fur family ferric uptake transcriptional regulator